MRFEVDPRLTPELREEIVSLWLDVSNAGGAVGFVPPVSRAEVWATAHGAFEAITAGHDRLLLGWTTDRLAAMLILCDGRFALTAHWRTVKRVMVHPDAQGLGHGESLMREGERVARASGLEALHITVRGGHGLEAFYRRVGYHEVGRKPGALRVGPGDDRDEVLMWLSLRADPAPSGSAAAGHRR